MGRLSERKREKNKKMKTARGWEGGKRFRSRIILKYTPAMRSRIWSTPMFATLCVILRSRVSIIYVGACYTRGARSRRSCGWWEKRALEGGGVEGGGEKE